MSCRWAILVLAINLMYPIMTTIICPTDFSKNATNATMYACALGEKFNSHIILLHAYESPALMTEMDFTIVKNAESMIKQTAMKQLETLRKKLAKKFPKVTFETMLAKGPGYEEVVTAATKNSADMIVMGTTGSSKMARLLMGSTTSRVLGRAGCPVLCIPKDAEFNDVKKIVFATDLNEDNIASAMTLAPFAMKFGAEIIFVFVDDKHLIHAEEDINRMTAKIRRLVKYPKISGFISKNTSITKGIEYFLKKYPADMLAMFTHQKHFPQALFNQSITKIMSHQTQIPLLALKISDRPVM